MLDCGIGYLGVLLGTFLEPLHTSQTFLVKRVDGNVYMCIYAYFSIYVYFLYTHVCVFGNRDVRRAPYGANNLSVSTPQTCRDNNRTYERIIFLRYPPFTDYLNDRQACTIFLETQN